VNVEPLPALAAYELWAPTYPPVAHNPLMRLEQDIVEPILVRLRARRALDVGTGSGRYLPVLESMGAKTTGVDFSMAMLRRCHRQGPRLVCADACHLPFARASFDVINASLMVGDVADLEAWTRESARVLARGGHHVSSDFHPSWAELGRRRTFTAAAGETHDHAFEPHPIDDHLRALEAARLRVLAIREPRFNAGSDAAVAAFRRRWGNPPVVAVFHATKEP
jgi:malonyl-CoA O-methyltransferase